MKHTVELGDTLYSIAKRYGISVEDLMKFNRLNSAAIRLGQVLEVTSSLQSQVYKHTVRAGESLYQIAKKYNLTVGKLKQMNRLASYNLRIGQELLVRESQSVVKTPPPIEAKNTTNIHIVQAGDTLYNIARKYNIKVDKLLKANRLASTTLKVGQRLQIGSNETYQAQDAQTQQVKDNAQKEFHTVGRGDTLYAIAQRYGLSVSKLVEINNLQSPLLSIGQKLFLVKSEQNATLASPPKGTEDNIHIVQKGESLYAIARQYGLSVSELSSINKLNSDSLSIGQQLLVASDKKTQNVNPSTYISYDIESNTLPLQMKSFIQERQIFRLDTQNGLNILANGIRSAVGRNRVNKPEDLEKVQDCLVQLKVLKYNHGENPKYVSNRPITANLIPQTIAAIERLQQKYKIKFWVEHSNRIAMMQTNQFTWGVVQPNDITFKFLKEFTQYRLSFSHPQTYQKLSVGFHNFTRSSFTQNYHGVSYVGYSKPDIPLDVFRRLGVKDAIAKALQFVSKHEGNFDAINSYDKAVFSWGFIQFAGKGGGFAPLLANIKHKAPRVFQEFFQKFGIDVEYETYNQSIRNAQLVVANPYDKGGKYISKGIEAEKVLSADKQLYGVFIRAGYHLPIVTLQIDAAIQNYVKPALNIRLTLRVGVIQINNAPITDFIKSSMGLALVIDLTINQWINKARAYFRAGIEEVAKDLQVRTSGQLYHIDERLIVRKIVEIAKRERDSRATYRSESILNSHLDFHKQR